MVEILLFSLSISIDALGYSIGFGSRNVNIKLNQFLVLNLINTLILTLYLCVFSRFEYFFKNPIICKISPILLAILGLYYVSSGFCGQFCKIKSCKNSNKLNIKNKEINYNFSSKYSVNFYEYKNKKFLINSKNSKKVNQKLIGFYNNESCLKLIDYICLLLVFIFENAFSTFMFYSNFNNAVIFVFTNFVFHFFFFILGFNIGKNIAIKINAHTSFLSGYIFLCLAYFELFF